jgi:hypothetical protein
MLGRRCVRWRGGRGFDLLFASVRLRYFGPRPLIEDDSVRSAGSAIVHLKLGYRIGDHWNVGLEVLNALDACVNDQQCYYSSRLPREPENPDSDDGGYLGRVIHPAEPISLRLLLSARL